MSHVIDWASNPLGIIDQLFGLYDLALEITTGFVFVTVGLISRFLQYPKSKQPSRGNSAYSRALSQNKIYGLMLSRPPLYPVIHRILRNCQLQLNLHVPCLHLTIIYTRDV